MGNFLKEHPFIHRIYGNTRRAFGHVLLGIGLGILFSNYEPNQLIFFSWNMAISMVYTVLELHQYYKDL